MPRSFNYRPATNYNGLDTVTYRATDESLDRSGDGDNHITTERAPVAIDELTLLRKHAADRHRHLACWGMTSIVMEIR